MATRRCCWDDTFIVSNLITTITIRVSAVHNDDDDADADADDTDEGQGENGQQRAGIIIIPSPLISTREL